MNESDARAWLHLNWEHLTVTGRLGEAIAKYYATFKKDVEKKVEEEKKEDEKLKTGEWIKGEIKTPDEEYNKTFDGKL